MAEQKIPSRKGDGSGFAKAAGQGSGAAGKPQRSAVFKAASESEPKPVPAEAADPAPLSAIEIAPPPAPVSFEHEPAVAVDAPMETSATVAVVEAVAAPVPAVVETSAAPDPVAATMVEPISAEPAQAEEPVAPTPDPVATLPFAPALTRGIFNMATTFDAATTPAVAADKMKAMFGGLNDRAKTAMAKSAKLSEDLGELTKGNVEAIVASSKVAAKGAETMAQEAVEYGKKNFESASTMFKSMAAAKSPTELFQLQSDYAKSAFDSAVAEASKLSEAWVKLAGEVVQPLSNRYAVAAEKLKVSAL